jgi:hypothetical protein
MLYFLNRSLWIYLMSQCFLLHSGGYYCITGATQSRPTIDSQGGKCKTGEYCPEGSSGPTICDGGKYCQQERLDAPTGLCDAGQYLTLNSLYVTVTE